MSLKTNELDHNKTVGRLNNLGKIAGLYILSVSIIFGTACYWLISISLESDFIYLTWGLVLLLFINTVGLFITAVIVRRGPIPEGFKVCELSHPKLFSDINDLQQNITKLKVDYVVINQTSNASMVKGCKESLFKKVNVITIGWPILIMLNKNEVRSIFAHELGHLHRNQKDIHSYTYKILSVNDLIQSPDFQMSYLLKFIFKPYQYLIIKRLENSFYKVSKLNEVRADEVEAKIIGSEIAGSSLLKLYIVHEFLNYDFYNLIDKQIYLQKEIGPCIYQQFKPRFLEIHSCIDYLEKVKNYLFYYPFKETTHPRLCKRLTSMGYDLSKDLDFKQSAAEEYFAKDADEIHAYFSERWLTDHKEYISKKSELAQKALQRVNDSRQQEISDQNESRLLEICWYYQIIRDTDKARSNYKLAIQLFPYTMQ